MNAPYINFKDVKSAVSIRQILERYELIPNLKEKGDALSGTCPICQSDSPRCFRVSQEKNCFKCFSCDAGGNILDLVGELESCNIREAAIKIAEWFDLLPKQSRRGSRKSSSNERKRREPKDASKAISKEAPEVSQIEKQESEPSRSQAQKGENKPLSFELQVDREHPWFDASGLSREIIERFGLGYCSKGMMAGRVVFPLRNSHDQLIGYAGLWVDGELPDGKELWKYPPTLNFAGTMFASVSNGEIDLSTAYHVADPLQVIVAAQLGAAMVIHLPDQSRDEVEGRRLSIRLEYGDYSHP